MNLLLGMAARTVGAKPATACLVQDRLSDDRTRRITSAKEEHVELLIDHDTLGGRTPARRGRLRDLRRITTRLLVGDTRSALASSVPVVDAFARRVKGLPRDTGRVVNPRLL